MKTAVELLKEGVTRIRRDPWNEYAYLELNSRDGKHYGPWVNVYDVVNRFEGEDPSTVLAFGCDLDKPIWESWVDPEV